MSQLRYAVCLIILLSVGCVSPTREVNTVEDMQRLERLLERAQDDRSHSITRRHASELLDTELSFRGRAVDQEGNGIPDARVQVWLFDRVLDPFHFPYFGYSALQPLTSDSDGFFLVEAERAVGLHIDVSVSGYTPVDLPHRTYQVEHVLPAGGHLQMPAPRETAAFTFRQTTVDDQLQPIGTGAVRFLADGTPIELSLEAVNPHGESSGNGDVTIGCQLGDTSQETYDWSCAVIVPGGGARVRDMLDFYQAPAAGYLEEIQIGFRAGADDWSDRIDEGVFFKLGSGHYAFVTLKVRTRGDKYFALEGRLNDHGTRILE